MSESKTPRTDEAQFGTGRVSVHFARELELELAEANKRILKWANSHGELCAQSDELQSQLTAAQKEIEKLRKDKERLDWLAKTTNGVTFSWPEKHPIVSQGAAFPRFTGDDLRQAIDSAMKGTKE